MVYTFNKKFVGTNEPTLEYPTSLPAHPAYSPAYPTPQDAIDVSGLAMKDMETPESSDESEASDDSDDSSGSTQSITKVD